MVAMSTRTPGGEDGASHEPQHGSSQQRAAETSPPPACDGWIVPAISLIASCLLPEASSKVETWSPARDLHITATGSHYILPMPNSLDGWLMRCGHPRQSDTAHLAL